MAAGLNTPALAETQEVVRDAHTVRNAAERLDLPYRTVLDLIHTGQLGHVPVGRYFLVPQVEIDRFLSERMVRAVTAA
jgi:excisionase family DNA binding protein